MSKSGTVKVGGPGASARGKRKRSRGAADAVEGGPSNPVRGAKYHCNYCNRDISGLVRIKCAECTDFDLCLECFSVGVQVYPHKNTHGYRVVDDLSFPLFATNWGADEELLLLEGVDMYGLGNWASVAEHVGTKIKEECERHYYQVYLKAGVGPAPTPTSTPVHTAEGLNRVETPPPKRYKLDAPEGVEGGEEGGVKEEEGVKAEEKSVAGKGEGEGEGEEEGRRKGKRGREEKKKDGKGVEVVGRRSAGVRADQGGGDELDEALGGNTYEVTGYNTKRDEFDPEYDNEAESCIADIEFDANDPEGIKKKKLRLLEIYNHRLDERDSRREFIRERKLLNVKKQQGLEKKRSAELNDLHAVMRVFARYLSQDEHEALVEGLYIERKLREHIDNLKEMRRRGYRTFADVEAGERESKFHKMARQGTGFPKPKAMGLQGKTVSSALREWRQKRGIDLDVTLLPGWELLSARERDLCCSSRFVPAHYLALKDRLLREADKVGFFPRQEAKNFFRLEAAKALKVYDIMLSSGWIRNAPVEKTVLETPMPEKQPRCEGPSESANHVVVPS